MPFRRPAPAADATPEATVPQRPSHRIPSAFDHTLLVHKEGVDTSDHYGHFRYTYLARTTDPAKATLVTSKIASGQYAEWHTAMLDLDVPATLVPSSTPGHSHLYIDVPMAWGNYRRLLKALWKAGIIEKSYYTAAKADRATHLRPPWTKKPVALTH